MKSIVISVFLLLLFSGKGQDNRVFENDIRNVFLFSNAEWMGDFQNYVNIDDGIIQNGKILVEISSSADTVKMRNSFINQQGIATDYTGYSKMLVRGNSIINLDDSGIDENTGNEITDYKYWGRILDNHVYIHESYREVFPDGQFEYRSNSVHYYLKSSREVIQLAEVWVNDSLLVFAGTILKRQEE